jgi:hypothetical protein
MDGLGDGGEGAVSLKVPGIMKCLKWIGRCDPNPDGWMIKGDTTIIGYVVLRTYFTHLNRADMTISFADGTSECNAEKADHPLPKLSPIRRKEWFF